MCVCVCARKRDESVARTAKETRGDGIVNYIELLRDVYLGGYELPSINVMSTTVHFPDTCSRVCRTDSVRLFCRFRNSRTIVSRAASLFL